MSGALRAVNYRNTQVTTKLPNQVENNTGGFVYQISDKDRLVRFLILGTDGGTYYVTEKELTTQNVSWLENLIQRDANLVLDVVLDVSVTGRAYRNSAALFALAMVLNHGSDSAKSRAVDITPQVARIPTHVFELAQYIENLGGWGRAKRRALAKWFTDKSVDDLAYLSVKYRQRNGWTLRDVMRLSHPVGVHKGVGSFILGKYVGKFSDYDPTMPDVVHGFMEMQKAVAVEDVLRTLVTYPSLPWETIPTQFLKSPEVWKKLFFNGQLNGQALVRNVVRLAKIGAFDDMVFAAEYAKKLTDEEMIRKTRLHPVQYLMAQVTYTEGQMSREAWSGSRSKSWNTNIKIVDALNAGFFAAFKYTEPSNKRTMIGVDVSGSMSWSSAVGSDMSAAQGSAAMAMVTARLEPYVEVLGFANTLRDLGITPHMGFGDVMKKVQMNNFGYTDPSLLITQAQTRRVEVDTFIVITDNEVNHGTHPSLALKNYRQKMGLDAKLVVMGMTATDFSIAEPGNASMFDVCGFDANTPKVVSDFSAGRI